MAEIEISRVDRLQIIRLNRPAKKNALTAAMYGMLADALESGDSDDAIAVHVLLGSDGVFSAGNDIHDFLQTGGAGPGLGQEVMRFIRALPSLSKPLIAGVDGPAIGIGTTLLLHCDLVYATDNAKFSTPFLDLGLVPEAASSLLLPLRMGYARAFEMLILGETLTAAEAREAGLINRIVPSDTLETTVLDAGRRLASKPPACLAEARRLMRGDSSAILKRTEDEAEAFSRQLEQPEAKAAFRAFLNKQRTPEEKT